MFLRFIAKGDKTESVLQAHCSCKAGSGGHCNHISALLFLVNDYSCSQITEVPSDLTCTSRLQTWHIPRVSSVCPMSVMATHFARSITDEESEKRKRDPVRCKLYDLRSFNVHHIMNNARMKKEADYLKSMEKRPPFSYLLDFQEPSVTINTVFGDVPLGSCLAHQLRDFGRPGNKFIFNREIPLINSPKCKGFPDIPFCQKICKNLTRI